MLHIKLLFMLVSLYLSTRNKTNKQTHTHTLTHNLFGDKDVSFRFAKSTSSPSVVSSTRIQVREKVVEFKPHVTQLLYRHNVTPVISTCNSTPVIVHSINAACTTLSTLVERRSFCLHLRLYVNSTSYDPLETKGEGGRNERGGGIPNSTLSPPK